MRSSSDLSARPEARIDSLFRVVDLTCRYARLDEFLPELAIALHGALDADLIGLVLPSDDWASAQLHYAQVAASGGARMTSVAVAPLARDHLTFGRIGEDDAYLALAETLRDLGQPAGCILPLSTVLGPVGLLVFASAPENPPDADELTYMHRIAAQVAVAIDNIQQHDQTRARERELQAERDYRRTMLELNHAVVTSRDLATLLSVVTPNLQRIVQHDSAGLILLQRGGKRLGLYAISPAVQGWTDEAASEIRPDTEPFATWLAERRAVSVDLDRFDFTGRERLRDVMKAAGEVFGCVIPLATPRAVLGFLFLSRRTQKPFTNADLERASEAGAQVAIALENVLAFGEIAELKDRLAHENIYLEEAVRGAQHFGEVVGESKALKRILSQVATVAATDSTVLLLGETGTGKELIARAIHTASERSARVLVTVNCAVAPAGLLESEWFGHEKGAFTGAISQKIGKFELAHQGTLFLDEIGDVPLDLQSKLLRVLQEHELERLGSNRTMRVDFRLIAATNRDLNEMVTDREFRADLYYRLNVFPIRIPPLRERPEDIPPLVMYFVQRFARRLRRPIEAVARESMDELCRWHWPGNVRELQNVIERAVILSQGPTLTVPRSEFESPMPATGAPITLEDAEREHILRALEQTGWVIGGPHGAAARLGVKRTSLASTMRRLGIVRPRPQSPGAGQLRAR